MLFFLKKVRYQYSLQLVHLYFVNSCGSETKVGYSRFLFEDSPECIPFFQEDLDSHLPRINASLFMSPGGEKFYQLLFDFSGYVLQKTLEKDLGNCSFYFVLI